MALPQLLLTIRALTHVKQSIREELQGGGDRHRLALGVLFSRRILRLRLDRLENFQIALL